MDLRDLRRLSLVPTQDEALPGYLVVPEQGQYCHHLSMKGIKYQSFDNLYRKVRTVMCMEI